MAEIPTTLPAADKGFFSGLASWAGEKLGSIGTLVEISIRFFGKITTALVGFWGAVTYYAKEIVTWVCDMGVSLLAKAIEYAEIANPGTQLVNLINQLPPAMLDVWARFEIWPKIILILAAFAVNMALRAIPFVGRSFQG